MQIGLIRVSVAALSMSVQLLPFWMLIFLSQNLREVAQAVGAQYPNTNVDEVMPTPQLLGAALGSPATLLRRTSAAKAAAQHC